MFLSVPESEHLPPSSYHLRGCGAGFTFPPGYLPRALYTTRSLLQHPLHPHQPYPHHHARQHLLYCWH